MGNEKFEAQRHPRLLSSLTIPGHYVEKQFTKAVSETNQLFSLGLGYEIVNAFFVNSDEHIEYFGIYIYIDLTKGSVVDTPSNDEKIEDISTPREMNSHRWFTYVISDASTKTIYIKSDYSDKRIKKKSLTTTEEVIAIHTITAFKYFLDVWSDTTIDGNGSHGIAGLRSASYTIFRINTNIENDQIRPSVASLPNSGVMVAWQSNHQNIDYYAIYAQKFNEDLTKDGSEFRLSGEGNYNCYDVDIDDFSYYSAYVAVWVRESCSEKRIECKTETSSIFLVDTNTQPGTESVTPSVSTSGKEFLVTWANKSPDSDYGTIYMRRFDFKGNPRGDIITVATDAKSPQIEKIDSLSYVIAWITRSNKLKILKLVKCFVDNCDSCPGKSWTCSTCARGYFLNEQGDECKACEDANCIECASDLTCNVCNAGFYLDEYYCKKCTDPNCRDCTDSSTCNDCNPGFFLSGNACEECTSPCVDCAGSGAGQCTMCECNTLPSASPGWCECISGTYESSTDPLDCSDCHSSCLECSGPSETECTACSSENEPFATGGRCVCENGTYEIMSNPLICFPCDPTCATCENDERYCLSCHSSSDSNCCPDGTYIDEFRCLKCSYDCETCELSAEKCLSCPGEANCCPEGTFFSQPYCVACGEKCSSCDEVGCLTCVEDSEDCCPKTRFLNTSSSIPKCEDCEEYDDIGCTKCPPNTNCCGERKQIGDRCIVCDELCLDCDEVGCLTCPEGVDCCEGIRVYDSNFGLCYCPYGPDCLTCDEVGCLICPEGENCCEGSRLYDSNFDWCYCPHDLDCLTCDEVGCLTCPESENCCEGSRLYDSNSDLCYCPYGLDCLTCDEVGCLTCPEGVDCCQGPRVYDWNSDSCYCPYGSNCLTCDEERCLTCVPGTNCCEEGGQIGDTCL